MLFVAFAVMICSLNLQGSAPRCPCAPLRPSPPRLSSPLASPLSQPRHSDYRACSAEPSPPAYVKVRTDGPKAASWGGIIYMDEHVSLSVVLVGFSYMDEHVTTLEKLFYIQPLAQARSVTLRARMRVSVCVSACVDVCAYVHVCVPVRLSWHV
jgi:hypothetical protein